MSHGQRFLYEEPLTVFDYVIQIFCIEIYYLILGTVLSFAPAPGG